MNLNEYEIVKFAENISNIKTIKRGVKIGQYLAVAPPNKVYNLITGKPVIDVIFKTLEDAIKFTEWIDGIFCNYFPIWEAYPDADVFSLAKWSVPNGLQMYEMLQLAKNRNISFEYLMSLEDEANQGAKKWINEYGQQFPRE